MADGRSRGSMRKRIWLHLHPLRSHMDEKLSELWDFLPPEVRQEIFRRAIISGIDAVLQVGVSGQGVKVLVEGNEILLRVNRKYRRQSYKLNADVPDPAQNEIPGMGRVVQPAAQARRAPVVQKTAEPQPAEGVVRSDEEAGPLRPEASPVAAKPVKPTPRPASGGFDVVRLDNEDEGEGAEGGSSGVARMMF